MHSVYQISALLERLWETTEITHRLNAIDFLGLKTAVKGKRPKFKYPANLIFGPEQFEAVTTQTNIKLILLTGEAGCGKTTTLLAILFKHTGKHIIPSKRKKVVFFVPQDKILLRRDIQNFARQHCFPDWVQISPLEYLDRTLINTETIYLIDEFYGPGPELTKKLVFSRGKFYIATISTQSKHGMLQSGMSPHAQIMYFRKLYRSTSDISKVCAKLRRLLDRKTDADSHMNIPWAMSFKNGPPMKHKNSIQTSGYTECQTIAYIFASLLSKVHRGTLMVSWKLHEDVTKQIDQQQPECVIYHLTADNLTVQDLHFTGSEFRNVIVVLGEKVDPNSDHTLFLLYNSITRATEYVHVLCCETILSEMKSILSLSTNSDFLFEKLRSSDNIGSELFANITDQADKLEIMKRIVATKNEAQFKMLKESGLLETQICSSEEKLLADCMQIMESSPTRFQPLVDFFLLEKKMQFQETFTLEDLRPVIGLMEPLRLILPSKGNQAGLIPFGENIEQTEIMAAILADLHPTDIRFTYADWIHKLTRGNADQIANIISLYDSQKIEKIVRNGLSVISRVDRTEILRNAVLLIPDKSFLHIMQKFALNFPEVFTKELVDDGSTLLHKYALGSSKHIFEVILEHLPEDQVWFSEDRLLDNCLQNPLMTAIGNTNAFVMITQRAKRQGDLVSLLAHRDVFGWSCLRWACRVDNLKVVKALIGNKDKSLDWTADLDPDGRTLIHLVCAVGHTHILRYLLTLDEKQPEPFKVTKATSNSPLDMTCLHLACLFGRAEIVKMLIEAAPDLALMDFQGINCLTLASRSIFKDKECIVNLLKGKLPNQQLNDTQEDLIHFMVSKIRSLNHNNFLDETEMNKIHPKSLKTFNFIFLFLFSLRIENQGKAAISENTFTFNCYIC